MTPTLRSWMVVVLLLGPLTYAIAEEITLTTYYPSPRGVYDELRTAGNVQIGRIEALGVGAPHPRLHVIQGGTGPEPAFRVDDEAPVGDILDSTPFLIDADGNVGIGTANPGAKLHVSGGGILLDNGNALSIKNPSGVAQPAVWWASDNGLYLGNTNDQILFRAGAGGEIKASLNSAGTFTATTKNFQIQHPTKPGYLLVHSTLEGPEIAVFYRGEAHLIHGRATVTLPDYFEALTRKGGRTVLLTPEFTSDDEPISALAASAVSHGTFTVRAADGSNPNQAFFWEVKATRADQPPLGVEQPSR